MCSNKCNYKNGTYFTCEQLNDYCEQYTGFSGSDVFVSDAINISMAVCGFVGLLGYIFMAGTLSKMKLDTASSIYYQSMVVMEILHMAVMGSAGIIRQQPTVNTDFSLAFWSKKLGCFWFFGNAMKLVVMIVATYLSMGSTIAILAPIYYRKCNNARVAVATITVAILYALLIHIPENLIGKLVAAPSGWIIQPTELDNAPFITAAVNAQTVSKLVFSVCLFALSCAIVVGLFVKSRNAKTLTGRDSENWKATNRLTALSLIVGVSTLIDNICWIVYKYIGTYNMPLLGLDAINSLSYEDALYILNYQYLYRGSRMVQAFTGELVHAGRFYLYMAFNKPFRTGFARFVRFNFGTGNSISSKPQ